MTDEELWRERSLLARDPMTLAKARAEEARERAEKAMTEQDDIVGRVAGLIGELTAQVMAGVGVEVFERNDMEGIWFRWRGLYWKLRYNGVGLEVNEEAFIGKAEAAWSISAQQWPGDVKAALYRLWAEMGNVAVGEGTANNARRLLARLEEGGDHAER